VFYDEYEQAEIWGTYQSVIFQEVYYEQSRWCIMLISKDYVTRKWPALEARHAIARQIDQFGEEYILPVTFDETDVPGLPKDIAKEDGLKKSPEEVVRIFMDKFGKRS